MNLQESSKDKKANGLDTGKGQGHVFKITIKVPYKTVLKAESMQEKVEWINKIRSVMQPSKGASGKICDTVAIARYLNVMLIVPKLDKTSLWVDPSDFKDIFDVDHFITSLREEVQIPEELPPRLMRSEARNGIFHATHQLVQHFLLP